MIILTLTKTSWFGGWKRNQFPALHFTSHVTLLKCCGFLRAAFEVNRGAREAKLRNCLRESILLLIVQPESQMLNGAGICPWVGEREKILLSPDKNFLFPEFSLFSL